MQKSAHNSGFTLLEVTISAGVMSMIILMGVTVSKSTLDSTNSSMARSEAAQVTARTFDRFTLSLASVGESTLSAIPTGAGSIPEPMLDGVTYQNMAFRIAAGYSNGVVYSPAEPNPPCQLWFSAYSEEPDSSGDLMYFDGTRVQTLKTDVQGVSFTLNGNIISMSMTAQNVHGEAAGVIQRSIVVRAP